MYSVDAVELSHTGTKHIFKEAAEAVIKMLSVFAPHIGEEMWELTGHEGRLTHGPWPAFDPALAAEEEIEIPVQINGKVRERILMPTDTGEEEIKRLALENEKIMSWIGGKMIVKVIVVPKRLVNIVIK